MDTTLNSHILNAPEIAYSKSTRNQRTASLTEYSKSTEAENRQFISVCYMLSPVRLSVVCL